MFLQQKNKQSAFPQAYSRASWELTVTRGEHAATPVIHRKSSARMHLLLLVASALAGCASPGPPKPPTLHLPSPPKALTAERVGDHVVLAWQTSPDTTDGQTLRGPITAQICRDDTPKPPPVVQVFPVPPDPCKVVHQTTVTPSTPTAPTQVVDELPAALATGKPRLMAYRVTLLNAKGRSAGPSAPVYAAAGAAPAAVGPIEVTPRRSGALIRWQPVTRPPAAPMQLTRTLLANAEGPVAPKKAKASGRPAPQAAAPLSVANSPTVPQITLKAEGQASSDPGGMVDHGIHDGDTVRYVAQRVLTVRLTPAPALVAGKKGKMNETKPVEQAFELRSEPSPEVTFTFHDTIPPAAPSGLVAVTGGGFGESPSIDLSWEPNEELDIAGYNVYRADEGSRFEKVNGELVTGPEFRDTTVEAGRTYVYRVTAVDRHRNESAPSATVKAEVRR
jgi:hypothetical protein